ncbi:hypothetical protein D3C86_1797390 [compost metagenome]
MVDRRVVAAQVVDRRAHAEARGLSLCDHADAALQLVAHAGVEGADADDDLGALRDDVAGRARMEGADGDDGRIHRVNVA